MSLDKAVLGRIAIDRGWDHDAILERYKFGIEWPMVRAVLRSKTFRPTARRALQVVQAGGFWSDERRWLCGLKEDPGCGTCQEAVGDDEHYFSVQCPAVQIEMLWRRIAGEPHATPCTYAHPELAPLNYLGLPPRTKPWKPAAEAPVEGWLSMGPDSTTYGDGSGYHQQIRDARIATWSVVRLRRSSSGQLVRAEALRGAVAGLFPTVPRAEMTALLQHLRHAGPGAAYGGDCQHVLDIARSGVPPYYTSSKCANADLWQAIRAAMEDHGGPMIMKKIKAHATQGAAVANGTLAEDWLGNHLADQHCKSLAKHLAKTQEETDAGHMERKAHRYTIDHISTVAAWAFRHRPQYAKGGRGRKPKNEKAREGTHKIEALNTGKWRCASCRREAWSQRALARLKRTDCRGHIVDACHHTHALTTTNGILWCRSCGAYTTRQPRSLRFPCTGRPRSEAAFNVRARLLRGLPPTTASYLSGASVTDPGPYLEVDRQPTKRSGHSMTDDNASRSSAAGGTDRHPHTRSHACAQTGTDGGGGSRKDSLQQPPAAVRRRIRGKSTPPNMSAATTAPATAAKEMNTAERREHDIAERTSRSRYRQLDLRTAPTEGRIDERHANANACRVQSPRASCEAPQSRDHYCSPAASAPWVHRLTIIRSSAAVECAICRASCRTRCAGCGAPCCVTCARERRPCSGAAYRRDRSHAGHAHHRGVNTVDLADATSRGPRADLGEGSGHRHSFHHVTAGTISPRADPAIKRFEAVRSSDSAVVQGWTSHHSPYLAPTASDGHSAVLGEVSGSHESSRHVVGGAAPPRADSAAIGTAAVGRISLANICDSMSHPPHRRDHMGTNAGDAAACALPPTSSVSSSSQGAAAAVDVDHGAQPCHGVPRGAVGFWL